MRALRLFRRLLAGLSIVVLLAVAAVFGLYWLSLPSAHQELAIAGLSAPAEIDLDADGVPHIRAASALDGATALGFVHARDRLFQMEMMRRAASGRISEIAGPATLGLDRMMRVLGLRVHAVADLAALPTPVRAMLDAYARGVNAWIAARGRFSAPEFVALGAPEPWSAVDSLLWAKTMGLWLSGNWRTELARFNLAGTLTARQIDELWPSPREGGHPEAAAGGGADATRALAAALPAFPAPFTLPGEASNAWAVDGSHTATGAPLLAGDPHLQFSLPGIWYLARIDTPDGVLAGATAPGVPFLVLGHNGHIAWSFTTTGADVQDLFVETPAGDGQYQTPDGPRPFTTREERIAVRGQPDTVLTVRETRHGPVVSDLAGAPGGPILAAAMANLQPGDSAAAGLFALNRAADVAAAGRAAAAITAPVQNLMVADRQRIALFVTGRVPLRRAGDGAAPVAGADGAHDWTGWASGEALPHAVAPASGRLVNANERVAPPDFAVFLGRDWFGDWRARRIRTLLAASDRLTVDDFTRMQTDVTSVFAADLLPRLRAVKPSGDLAGRAVALLQDWHGEMRADLPQPLLVNAWMDRFRDGVLARNKVPPNAANPTLEFLAFVLSPAGAHWCGEAGCDALLADTLGAAAADLAARFGTDPAAWRWGEPHRAVFSHPLLAALPGLRWFATASIPSAGDDATVDRGSPRDDSFASVHGASFRGVYDLADLGRSRFVMAPGQSGNPFSAASRNFLTRWRDGATITLDRQPAGVAATIRLSP